MIELSQDDKTEIKRILDSVQGRIDEKLVKFIMELVFKTRVRSGREDNRLFSVNIDKIPARALDAFSLGSFFGQTYQIALDIAKKMDIKLKIEQKRIMREFVLFIVLFKYEKELSLE